MNFPLRSRTEYSFLPLLLRWLVRRIFLGINHLSFFWMLPRQRFVPGPRLLRSRERNRHCLLEELAPDSSWRFHPTHPALHWSKGASGSVSVCYRASSQEQELAHWPVHCDVGAGCAFALVSMRP